MHFLLIKPIPASNRIPDQLLLSITPKRSKEQSPQYPCASKYIRKKVSNSVIPNFHWFFFKQSNTVKDPDTFTYYKSGTLWANEGLCGNRRLHTISVLFWTTAAPPVLFWPREQLVLTCHGMKIHHLNCLIFGMAIHYPSYLIHSTPDNILP